MPFIPGYPEVLDPDVCHHCERLDLLTISLGPVSVQV